MKFGTEALTPQGRPGIGFAAVIFVELVFAVIAGSIDYLEAIKGAHALGSLVIAEDYAKGVDRRSIITLNLLHGELIGHSLVG